MKKVLIWSVAISVLIGFVACGGGGGGGGGDKTVKLFGTVNPGGNSVLVMLSPEDGSFMSTIGSVGHKVNGLEYDAVSNKLYGTTDNWDLIDIDMTTGVASTIGPGAGTQVTRPTVNSEGLMVVWSPWDSGDDIFYVVDTATGDFMEGEGVGFTPDEHGLAFDNEDNLYLISFGGDIYVIGPFITVDYKGTIGTRAHHGDFHPETGYYWGIDETNSSAVNDTRQLLVVDVNTPSIISTLTTVDNLHSVTFYYE